MKTNRMVWTVVLALGAAPSAYAQQGLGVQFTGSGFLTVAAGKILGGTPDNADVNPGFLGYKGPHFITDWAQGGVYEDNGLQTKPDTRLGLQGSAIFSPQFSVTGQIVTRGARDYRTNLEWLYGSYKLDDHATVQVGRKRLPYVYYSESQDVSFSYPWVHLPSDTYGWQVVNYNGANLMYQNQIGEWSYTANVFAGSETNKDTGYQKMYNGKDTKTNVRWTNILGGELIVSKDWLEARVGHFRNDAENGIPDTGDYNPKYRQKIYTASVVVDYNNWIFRNEYYYGDFSSVEYKDFAQYVSLGYRIGKFTPMLTYSRYYMKYDKNGPSGYTNDDEERHDLRSFSVRYDLTTSSAVKVQYDSYRDRSGLSMQPGQLTPYVGFGKARLLTISYDMVF